MAEADARDRSTQRFVFVLLDRFTMLAFASAIEPLRVANRMAGWPAFDWKLAAEGGAGSVVRCSNGVAFTADMGFDDIRREDIVLVCGGLDIEAATTRGLMAALRRIARMGTVLGGLCTGAHALARAGLLDGRRATIHWENHDGFVEEFGDVALTKSVFVIDGARMTSAGGTASIDLMLAIIARRLGEDLAAVVADQLIYSAIRTDQDTQRLSIPTRIGVRHPKLAAVIARMEAAIEEPVSPATLAEDVGLSTRQLERLFRRYLNRSPKRYYMELRLARARNLLMQTDMSVIEVALACGFTSPSHFSKCYRAQYRATPYRERGAQGAEPQADPAED